LRAKVDRDLRAYKAMAAAAKSQAGGGKASPDSAAKDYEHRFFNNMLLLLDYFFVHRLRTIEGKDGNPLNEVRVICDSILHNQNRMGSDTSIKLIPAESVLKHQVGDQIKLTQEDFLLMSKAFFAEIETKYL
jgi:hypothetical protein